MGSAGQTALGVGRTGSLQSLYRGSASSHLGGAVQERQAAGRVVLEHANVQEAHRRVALQHQPLPLLRGRARV